MVLVLLSNSLALAHWEFTGPLSSAIATCISSRAAVMSGGILISLGLAASSFATSLVPVFISFGIVGGMGLGLAYTTSIVVVNYFFENKRNFVVGLALSGSGTGILISPLLCRYLLDTFAWREVMMIIGGIGLHVTLFGALMYPVHEKKKTWSCLECSACKLKSLRKTDEAIELETKLENGDATQVLIDQENRDPSRDETKSILAKISSFSILQNKAFLCLCVNQFLLNMSCGVINVHFPAFCEYQGTSVENVALVMAVNGPANIISRILAGAFINSAAVDIWLFHFGILLLASVFIFITPLIATTFSTQVVCMVFMGLYLGGSYALPAILTLDCVGIKVLSPAFGLEMIFSGIGFLVGPPFAGWVVDMTGSYSYSMYLAGGIMFLAAVLNVFMPQLLDKNRIPRLRNEEMIIKCPVE